MSVSLAVMLSALRRGDSLGAYEGLHPLKDSSVRESLLADPSLSAFFESTDEKYKKFASESLPCIPYSLFRRFDTPGDGDRKTYENLYFNGYGARVTAGAMKMLFGGDDNKACDFLSDALWSCCDMYTWSLPAHLWHRSLNTDTPRTEDDAFKPVSSPRDCRCEVDLFASMMAADFSEILYLLEDRLPAIVVKRVRENIFKRIFTPMTEFNRVFFWEICTNNWAAVCAGSVGCAAVYSIKDSELLAPLLTRMCAAMDRYLDGFGKDAVCDEGITYWIYGFRHYIAFADLLYRRTAGAVNLFNDPRVAEIARFPEKVMLNGNTAASFADCPMNVTFQKYMYARLKAEYPSLKTPSSRQYAPVGFDRVFAYMSRKLLWNTVEETGFSTGSFVAPNAQWTVIRSDGSAFACKGGHNAESHNHNDVGSFILQLGENQFCADLGPGEYTAQYFGSGRYQTVNCGSHGHSVPIIDGSFQRSGGAFRAKNAVFGDSFAEFDISCAYGLSYLTALNRHFVYTPNGETVLTLTDSFEFTEGSHIVTERIVTAFKPEISADSVIISDGAGKAVLSVSDGWRVSISSGKYISQSSSRLYADDGGESYYFIDFERELNKSGEFILVISIK